MGASLASRLILAAAFLLVSLLAWESAVAWDRYEPLSGTLGGFVRTPAGIQVREPGFRPREAGWQGPGALVQASGFAGARYDLVTPRLLAPLLGTESRVRLTGLLPGDEGRRPAPWGGGRDPLGQFLWITRPLTGLFLYIDRVDVFPPTGEGSLQLASGPDGLALVPGTPSLE